MADQDQLQISGAEVPEDDDELDAELFSEGGDYKIVAPGIEHQSEAISIRYNTEYSIVQANELLRSKQTDLTLMETKLIRLAISQIMKGDDDFRTYRVSAIRLAKFLDLPRSNVYRAMQDMNMNLMKRVIMLRDKDNPTKKGETNYKILHWLSSVEYKDKVLTYRLSDELKPYLIGLNEMFTTYSYEDIIHLPTPYAIRLYELLASWVNTTVQSRKGKKKYKSPFQCIDQNGEEIPIAPNEIIFTVEYLKEFFDCNDKYKNNVGDFIRAVIESSIVAVNKHTMMRVKLRKYKTGRTITHIIFTFLDSFLDDPDSQEYIENLSKDYRDTVDDAAEQANDDEDLPE